MHFAYTKMSFDNIYVTLGDFWLYIMAGSFYFEGI